MSESTDKDLHFTEPPGELIRYPTNRIIAFMDSPDEVAAAIEELAQEGFERDQIFVLCGPKGAERLDVSGRHHGLRGRLYRFAEHFGGEREHLARNAEHLGAGGLTISVPADEEKKSTVARILGRNGGHEMTHYGKGHWEHISP